MSKKDTGEKPKKGKGLMLKAVLGLVLVGAGGGGAYALVASGLVGATHAKEDDKWDPLESTCRHASLSIL